jgi:hypothetical protein
MTNEPEIKVELDLPQWGSTPRQMALFEYYRRYCEERGLEAPFAQQPPGSFKGFLNFAEYLLGHLAGLQELEKLFSSRPPSIEHPKGQV